MEDEGAVRLGLCYPLVVTSNIDLKSIPSWKPYSLHTCIALIFFGPFMPWKKVGREYDQCCRIWTDHKTLWHAPALHSSASFSHPSPTHSPPSYYLFCLQYFSFCIPLSLSSAYPVHYLKIQSSSMSWVSHCLWCVISEVLETIHPSYAIPYPPKNYLKLPLMTEITLIQ